MPVGGVAYAADYSRLIELFDTDGTTLVETLNEQVTGGNSDTAYVIHAEFNLNRQGGCEGGYFRLDKDLTGVVPEVGQWIKCSYKSGSPMYWGRIESVDHGNPAGIDVRTFGTMSALSEVQVGGQPWWSDAPQTFGKVDYFTSDPDYYAQTYNYIPTMQLMVETMYNDYIASYPGGTVGLDLIDAPTVDGSFSSMTFRGGESLTQIIRSLADAAGNAAYGVDANNEFFFIPYNSASQHTFQDGVHCDIVRKDDKSLTYNRVVITGGYVYGAWNNPPYYLINYHQEDSASVAIYGAKTVHLKMPWLRSHVDLQNFANGFLSKYSGVTTRYTVSGLVQGANLLPWEGGVTLKDEAGTTLGTYTFDSVKVDFDEAPVFEFTTGPQPPRLPNYDAVEPQSGELASAAGGGGGGGDASKVSGWSSTIGAWSVDSCYWPPCPQATCGFHVTSAFPDSGYVIGDVYYMTSPMCPRTGITFFDMEDPIGTYMALGDSGLVASDYEGRMGTATYMRRYDDHDVAGCKWVITGLWCG